MKDKFEKEKVSHNLQILALQIVFILSGVIFTLQATRTGDLLTQVVLATVAIVFFGASLIPQRRD